MRALPIIERVLLVIVAVLIVALLVFLLVWHLRWRWIFAHAAAIPAPAGIVIPAAVPVPAEVAGDLRQWVADCRGALGQDPTMGFWRLHDSPVIMCIAPLVADRSGCAGGAKISNLAEPLTVFPPLLGQDLADRLAGLLSRGLRFGQVGAPGEPTAPDDDLPLVLDLCARSAARWRARILSHGVGDLDALDSLVASLGPRCAWIDSAGVICSIRDAAYLDAQLAGTLDPARLARWRTPDDPLAQLLVALDCRRRFIIPAQIAANFARPPWLLFAEPAIDANGEDLGARLRRWSSWPDTCSCICTEDGRDLDAIATGNRTRRLYDASMEASILLSTNRHRFALLASAIASACAQGRADLRDLDLRGGPARSALRAAGDATRWEIDLSPTQDPPYDACWADVPEQSPDEGIIIHSSDLTRLFFAWDGQELQVQLPAPVRPGDRSQARTDRRLGPDADPGPAAGPATSPSTAL